MKSTGILSNRLFQTTTLVTAFLALIYILINLAVIGGDEFVYSLNNNITIPLAIFTTLFAFSLWSLLNIGRTNRLLWGGLLAGWALWTIAEILWVVYGFIYQDIPYPSPADAFWLVGYIPMGYGLYYRSRELPIKTKPDAEGDPLGGLRGDNPDHGCIHPPACHPKQRSIELA